MKKAIIAAAIAVSGAANAGSLHGSDWGAIFELVTTVAGAAAQGYANAQAASQQPMPNVFYTGWSMDPNVGLLCHYSDGSQRPYPTLADCPASFYLPQ